jgi:hypothetical protein
MADTKESRDEQAHNAEQRRREHDLEQALKHLRAARDREDDREGDSEDAGPADEK